MTSSRKTEHPKKYALVTGGSSGIGASFARALAARGHHVLIVALDDDHLYRTRQEITENYPVSCEVFGINLAGEHAATEISKWISDHQFSINILINNAGIGSKEVFENIETDFYRKQLMVNVVNTVLLTRLLVENLKDSGPSYILNMGSLGGFFHIPEKVSYVASKAFIHSFSKSLRYELEPEGIHVVLLCPGGIISNENTKMIISELKGIARKSVLDSEELADIALNRMFAGDRIIIPGLLNKSFYHIQRLLPGSVKSLVIKHQFARKSKYKM
ncbi:SDR family NAD(P)-dependent oxidoreductase [Chryseobacterium sp. MFBS3-17]|uniref:SDR family NAD(P)-dependent oxidoreductase n=1 Tax=Chryseobacterium sp. MFBS3-17 TaxID=2886689 RepID=UPI001D0EA7EB|nr:SDR family NAD(P)-dependent oxidoreductase [Chryseobacterium sp. MFBS3-17]MCC2590214.1 SDR family NAD(P)-dependent oxidoreductase [Chryseobacterium sp. MFBS3-17]